MSAYTDEVQQQRVQLCRLYEQKESLTENIKGLKQIIATLEYVDGKETEKEEAKLQDIIDRAKSPKPKQSNIKE